MQTMLRNKDAGDRHWQRWRREHVPAGACMVGTAFFVECFEYLINTGRGFTRGGELVNDLPQALDSAVSRKPVGNVTALLNARIELREVEHSQATHDATQIVGNQQDMITPRLVIVAADDDISALQNLVELQPPLTRAHGVARRRYTVLAKCIYVFLALNYEHNTTGDQVLDQLGKSEWDDANTLDRPLFLVGSLALAERFRCIERLEAKYLKQALTGLIGVVEDSLDRTEVAAIGVAAFTRFGTAPTTVMTEP